MAKKTQRSPAKADGSRKVRRVVIGFVSILFGLYVLVCAIAYAAQRYILFPAPKGARNPSDTAGSLLTVDGGTVILFQKPTDHHPVLVYFHGNGDQLADLDWLSSSMSRMGVGFAGIEYPGYGLAADRGKPSEASILDAAERGIRHLLDHEGITKEQIILGGHSLGTGVAMAMAERGFGVRIMLLAPFTSIPDIAAGMFPLLPARRLLKDQFDSLARAKNIQVPVLIVHGTEDELIPIAHGRKLASQLSHARFLPIVGAGHNEVWSHPDTTMQLFAFIRAWEPKVESGDTVVP
jgi:pimeloyl-ACP methyl ester carboxylesterase